MKVALFKIQSAYAAASAVRAVLFHGDVGWFVDYAAKNFARGAGLAVDPVVNLLNAKEFFSRAQQATFFSHDKNESTACLISGVESGTISVVQSFLDDIPEGTAVVMVSHAYLRPSSGLRRHFEKKEDCMIVPVFTPTDYQINTYIQNFLQEQGLRSERRAVTLLAQNLTHFIDQVGNVLDIVALYHGDGQVTAEGVQACLNAVRMQPNAMRVVLGFFACKPQEFFDGIRQFDFQDTAELLFFLRLLQDATLAILLSKEALLSPSDMRAMKWQAIMGTQKMWDRTNLARILAWILRAEVNAKKKEFLKDIGFLFEFFVRSKLGYV